ncbi:hypothetical protein BDR26DRAFT_1004069, partial [Obelidium mucronatum]
MTAEIELVAQLIEQCEWSILVPASDATPRLDGGCDVRASVFNDELLHFYVAARGAAPLRAAAPLLKLFDIQVSAAAAPARGLPEAQQQQQGVTLYSYAYKYEEGGINAPIVTENSILFPLRIPINMSTVSSRLAFSDGQELVLSINATVQPVMGNTNNDPKRSISDCDAEDFDAVNLFDGLIDDPFFNPNSLPTHRLPFQFKKKQSLFQLGVLAAPKFIRQSLPLISPLRVDTSVVHPDSQKMILTVDVSNILDECLFVAESDVPICILGVDADLSNSVIKPLANLAYPVAAHSGDQLSFLFNIFKLDRTIGYSNSVAPPSAQSSARKPSNVLSLTVKWTADMKGLRNQIFESKWYCLFDESSAMISGSLPSGKENARSVGLSHYDLSAISKGKVDVVDSGLEISFRVMPPVYLRSVFTVEMLVVNTSPKARTLRVTIPQKSLFESGMEDEEFDPKVGRFTKLHMPVGAFMKRLVAAECREASMFCLENNFDLGYMPIGSCQS